MPAGGHDRHPQLDGDVLALPLAGEEARHLGLARGEGGREGRPVVDQRRDPEDLGHVGADGQEPDPERVAEADLHGLAVRPADLGDDPPAEAVGDFAHGRRHLAVGVEEPSVRPEDEEPGHRVPARAAPGGHAQRVTPPERFRYHQP